jgi:hypothetical protein
MAIARKALGKNLRIFDPPLTKLRSLDYSVEAIVSKRDADEPINIYLGAVR